MPFQCIRAMSEWLTYTNVEKSYMSNLINYILLTKATALSQHHVKYTYSLYSGFQLFESAVSIFSDEN